MKTLIALILVTVGVAQAQPCNRPVDPKKVVLMISFHDGSEEEKGARQGACARGETLVVIPKATAEHTRNQAQYAALQRRATQLYEQSERCGQNTTCNQRLVTELEQLGNQAEEIQERIEASKPDYKTQLEQFLSNSRNNGAKVNSLIISGHDGGGHYYGDYGETTMAEVSNMVKENLGAFGETSSLLLMGCWTGTPDQVEQYRAIFPQMRVLGGFVGSAPASTRLAAGTYIAGLLRGERNLPRTANRAAVQSMLNTVQHLNMVTAGVYVNPSCDETGRSPAYYYISPANADNELPEDIRPGLNVLPSADARTMACLRMFGGEGFRGTYDWNAILQYYQGVREPENNNELRSLYSFIRNNDSCFGEGRGTPAVSADQILFLRFFQDTKKNFEKYFRGDIAAMYEHLGKLVGESADLQLKSDFEKHKKLQGPGLLGMTRAETLANISALQGIYDRVYAERGQETEQDRQVRKGMTALDQHLYRLQCLPPTWHEYAEGETLAPPSC